MRKILEISPAALVVWVFVTVVLSVLTFGVLAALRLGDPNIILLLCLYAIAYPVVITIRRRRRLA